MDHLTPSQRRKAMQGNKSSGTKPEIILGKALFAAGLRYRKNNKTIVGTPDFSFKKYKVAVFADGDYWHGKDWENRKKKLGANAGFWFEKIERNIERDYKVSKQLCEDGWTVLRFWETDIIKNLAACVKKVVHVISMEEKRIVEERHLTKKYHKKITVPNECSKEVINEYLADKSSVKGKSLKKKAVQKTKEILQYKYPEENITTKVAEDTLKYGSPKN